MRRLKVGASIGGATDQKMIAVEVSEAVFDRLEQLTLTGFFGQTVEDTAAEFLRRGVREEWINRGQYDDDDDPNWRG